MGRGGGPLVSGDRVGEGRDGEAGGGARGQRHWEYRFVFGAPGSRVLQALGLCGRPGWDPRNGVFQKAQEAEMMPNPLCCLLIDLLQKTSIFFVCNFVSGTKLVYRRLI